MGGECEVGEDVKMVLEATGMLYLALLRDF